MTFDFDRPLDRTGTDCIKWDARRAFFGAEDLLPLWVADMDFAAPEAVTQALVERARHPVYGYTRHPEAMLPALTGWMRQRHGWEVDPSTAMIAPGVVPTLHAAVLAFTEPADFVIVQPPVYPPFFKAVTQTGRRLLQNPLRLQAGRYTIDFAHLEACAARGAKLLLFCSPHNPVGRVWSEGELRTLLRIAEAHGMTILSDEIHHDLVYPDARHLPLAALSPEHELVVTAVAPSKTFNVPGLGISAVIAPRAAQRTALARTFARLHAGNHNPFSLAAFVAAYTQGGPWLRALMDYLQRTRAAVLDAVRTRMPGVAALQPEGTYLMWLDFRALQLTDQALHALLVQRARVALSPGSQFGEGGAGFMRINLGAPRATVMEAVARIAAALPGR